MSPEDKLITQLNNLRRINPSEDFASKLRIELLSTPRTERKHFWKLTGFRLSIKESLGFAASVAVVAALILAFIDLTPQTASPLIGTNIPGAESTNMLNAANAAVSDINIHLDEVNSFSAAAKQTSKALSDINPSAVNTGSLNSENNSINASSTDSNSASQINSILDEVSNN
ncbi:MAG: hypothetical protein M1361_02395 [Patescibacteria group bacterium]|nr:hypothetical protein [Patescibacteria group bacterium]MCL5224427.1 hypothetical protein [Patescibacteria group bacterium]